MWRQNVVGRLQFLDCVIYKADEAGTELTQVAALGAKNPHDREILNPLKIPFGQGITGGVAQSKKAVIIDDLLKDQTYIADSEPARSEICVPLVSQGRVVGVIDSEHPEIGAFDAADLEVLTTVAAMTSAKLELLAEVDRSHSQYLALKNLIGSVLRKSRTARRLRRNCSMFAKWRLLGNSLVGLPMILIIF